MGRYDKVSERTGWGLPGTSCPTGEEIDELLELTLDPDPKVRRLALKNLCPCHVRRSAAAVVWERILTLSADDDAGVRHDAIHALIDGSPAELAQDVYAVMDRAYHDPHPSLRRYVRRMRSLQRRTGRVNVG